MLGQWWQQDNDKYFRIDRLDKNGGLMFYNQYTFNFFKKSKSLNLSDSMMKLIEKRKILLF